MSALYLRNRGFEDITVVVLFVFLLFQDSIGDFEWLISNEHFTSELLAAYPYCEEKTEVLAKN